MKNIIIQVSANYEEINGFAHITYSANNTNESVNRIISKNSSYIIDSSLKEDIFRSSDNYLFQICKQLEENMNIAEARVLDKYDVCFGQYPFIRNLKAVISYYQMNTEQPPNLEF